jgi:hypothetical protein
MNIKKVGNSCSEFQKYQMKFYKLKDYKTGCQTRQMVATFHNSLKLVTRPHAVWQ